MLPNNIKLVVAFDVGTTHSGYAYSFTNKPEEINVGSFKGRPPNTKTPTSLLLNKGQCTQSMNIYIDSAPPQVKETFATQTWVPCIEMMSLRD